MLLWDVQIAMIQINLLMKSHHQKLGEKTDVATEYTKEDEYKELEKKLRILNKSQFLMKLMHLLQKKVLQTKRIARLGRL